jgi:hypothetical protein
MAPELKSYADMVYCGGYIWRVALLLTYEEQLFIND